MGYEEKKKKIKNNLLETLFFAPILIGLFTEHAHVNCREVGKLKTTFCDPNRVAYTSQLITIAALFPVPLYF